MSTKKYTGMGLMSGSSLDGLDIAICTFEIMTKDDGAIGIRSWHIDYSTTIPYSDTWIVRLKATPTMSATDLLKTHAEFGHFLGQRVNEVVSKWQRPIDFLSLHGHTVYHYPGDGYSFQLGSGASLYAATGIPVISDFRNIDIALGGQGAPLAPIVEKYLLAGYEYYLNIGGIANITIMEDDGIIAFDVCPANQILNALSGKLGLPFDDHGGMARKGKIHADLLNNLNQLDYYSQPPPKSLDNGFTAQIILPQLLEYSISIEDTLASVAEHIAVQIQRALSHISGNKNADNPLNKMHVSGGGVFNTYLLERINYYLYPIEVVIPNEEMIQYKEALLMAWMGVLRLEGQVNVLCGVTGSEEDNIGGAVWGKE